MKAKDYIKKMEELDADYKQKLKALAIVWTMFNPNTPAPVVNPDTGRTTWTFEVTKREAALQAMRALSDSFQTKDVRLALDQLNDEWSAALDDDELSSLVARIVLGHDSGFEVVEPKAGRSPAKYKQVHKKEGETE